MPSVSASPRDATSSARYAVRHVPLMVMNGMLTARARAIVCGFVLMCLAVGCASFPDSPPSFTVQPSLTPNIATPVVPGPDGPAGLGSSETPASPTPPADDSESPAPSGPAGPPDPCAPPQLPVVAVCLDEPWGLAPLPDGSSAFVGERTTGRILLVTPEADPVVVAVIDGIDASGDGGLLGIALSPYFPEDNLIYLYVTTAADNRILRLALGQTPKPILTGIPKGDTNNGGAIMFGPDGALYVATGNVEVSPATEPTPGGDSELSGALLRVDTFGNPAKDNSSGTAVFASGLRQPTGLCLLPDGQIGAMDHHATSDVLLIATNGADLRAPTSRDTLWTYQPGDGGALDCAVSDGFLMTTAHVAEQVTAIRLTDDGGFTDAPHAMLDGEFGFLRTITTGPGGVAWITTRNTTHRADLTPRGASDSDDRVIILPPDPEGGGGGVD